MVLKQIYKIQNQDKEASTIFLIKKRNSIPMSLLGYDDNIYGSRSFLRIHWRYFSTLRRRSNHYKPPGLSIYSIVSK